MEKTGPQWYALKVFYNKVFEMEDLLEGMGMETFLAVEKVQLKGAEHLQARRIISQAEPHTDRRFLVEGPVIYRRVPCVTSLLFVKTDTEGIRQVDDVFREAGILGRPQGFVYRQADRKDFCTIPTSQMKAFRLVVESGETGLAFFSGEDLVRFSQGSKVRVKEGPLKGAEGYIKRIKKDRRLLVCIEGVIAVATSFIPPDNLEIIDKK